MLCILLYYKVFTERDIMTMLPLAIWHYTSEIQDFTYEEAFYIICHSRKAELSSVTLPV